MASKKTEQDEKVDRLKPEERIVELGRALVKQVFSTSRVGSIAGCYVAQGSIQYGCRIRVNRDGRTIGDCPLDSLKRNKEDVKEVPRGMECGIRLSGFDDVKQDDVLEAYRIQEVARVACGDPVLTEAKLKVYFTAFSEYTSITPDAVALILREGHGDEFFSGDKLAGLTRLSDGVAECLSQYRGKLKLNRITEISDLSAASLGKHEGDLALNGLTCLSDTAAESLSQHKDSLSLNGLTDLSETAAKSLIKHEGPLSLDGLTHLSVAVATSLSERTGRPSVSAPRRTVSTAVSLHGLTDLTVEAADILSRRTGILHLKTEKLSEDVTAKLRHLTKEIAEQLVTRPWDYFAIRPKEFRTIDDVAAECLIEATGTLNLDGLTTLSDAAATSLGKRSGKLTLLRLKTISDRGLLTLNSASTELPRRLTSRLRAVIKKHAETSSLLDRKQQAKIRKLLMSEEPGNVKVACELLTAAQASEGDWLRIFTKTRIRSLLSTWTPEIWNTLSTAMKPYQRLWVVFESETERRINTRSSDPSVHHKYNAFLSQLIEVASDDTINLLNETRPYLQLNTENLSDRAADRLTRYSNKVVLRYLRELTDTPSHVALAKKLADQRDVEFYSLNSLSDAAAESLSQHKGDLDLSSLNSLSDAAAKSFSGHVGTLRLGTESLSDAAAESLSQHKEK